jgi:hypothetical protein
MESCAKSYMGKGFLIYEEMRIYIFNQYEETVSHTVEYMTLHPTHSEFPYIWNISFSFSSVHS